MKQKALNQIRLFDSLHDNAGKDVGKDRRHQCRFKSSQNNNSDKCNNKMFEIKKSELFIERCRYEWRWTLGQ